MRKNIFLRVCLVQIIAISSISNAVHAQSTQAARVFTKQQQLYVGVEPCNNGEVATFERHKGCSTLPIGFTIDAADAVPEGDFVEVFAGDDVVNNKIVSPNDHHLNGSTQSIGYLSRKPVRGGKRIRVGNAACNNGTATLSTNFQGCGTEFLGYALPQKWPR